MPAVTLELVDLTPFADIDPARAEAMIADAVALAALVAPCILSADFPFDDAARAILRGAVLRWNEAGTGALSQSSQTAGPYGLSSTFDTRQQRRSMFYPSEITQLQNLCRSGQSSGAFSIDTVCVDAAAHADICSINFGADYCSCGAVLAGFPLYEV